MLKRLLFWTFTVLLVAACVGTPVLAQSNADAADRIRFQFSVMGKDGQYLRNLVKEDFEVFDGKESKPILEFSPDAGPATIGILIDLSGSIQPAMPGAISNALSKVISDGNLENEYLFAVFHEQFRLVVEPTQDRRRINDGLELLKSGLPKKNTRLNDAITNCLLEMERSKFSRRVLVVISDGSDTSSNVSHRELLRTLKEGHTTVYFAGDSTRSSGVIKIMGQASMDEIASVTGGRAFYFLDEKELTDVLQRIIDEIESSYVLAFSPSKPRKAKQWRKVVINARLNKENGKVRVIHREGYYAKNSQDGKIN